MLIVSRFHDYYDSAVGYGGVDKTVVYQRVETDLRKNPGSLHWASERFTVFGNVTIYVQPIYVGFCGEMFPAIGFLRSTDSLENFVYRYSVDAALEEFTSRGIPLKLGSKRDRWRFRRLGIADIDSVQDVKGFFSEAPVNKQKAMDAFTEHKVPVFYYRACDDNFVLNPCLKSLGFQQVKDSFTAFQEIHGYISGVLGVDARPMVELSDESKIEKHGFFEWSFRKEPWKKQKKKNPPGR